MKFKLIVDKDREEEITIVSHYANDFVAKIEKKRYNGTILRCFLGKYAMQFDHEERVRKEIFCLRVSF